MKVLVKRNRRTGAAKLTLPFRWESFVRIANSLRKYGKRPDQVEDWFHYGAPLDLLNGERWTVEEQ